MKPWDLETAFSISLIGKLLQKEFGPNSVTLFIIIFLGSFICKRLILESPDFTGSHSTALIEGILEQRTRTSKRNQSGEKRSENLRQRTNTHPLLAKPTRKSRKKIIIASSCFLSTEGVMNILKTSLASSPCTAPEIQPKLYFEIGQK